jgi:hypothetical protein
MSRINRLSIVALFSSLIAVAPARGQQFSSWSAPNNLGPVVNSRFGDFFPTISKDGLSLYFTSSRNPEHPDDPTKLKDWDIYVSQRSAVSEPWGPPQNLGPKINTPFDEGAPTLSIDGHRMYFASNRPGGFGGNDIYVSRRHDRRDDFGWEFADNVGGGVGTDLVNTEANEASPAIFEDDATGALTLYFDSNRPGGPGPFADDSAHNGNDIYTSILGPDEMFGPAVLVAELSTPSLDRQPAVRRDGLEIFFASNRPAPDGAVGFDLWVSTRATTREPWLAPQNLGLVVNSRGILLNGVIVGDNDTGPALSFGGTELYFQSNRPGGFGAFDLYVARRTKLRGHGVDQNEN